MNVKRTIVTLLLLLTLAGAASAASPSWYWLCSDATSTTYLDNSHVYKNDDCAIVWTRTNFQSGAMAGDVIYMEWHVTRAGEISYIYGHGHRANGRLTRHYPGAYYWNKAVSSAPNFKKLYNLIWPA